LWNIYKLESGGTSIANGGRRVTPNAEGVFNTTFGTDAYPLLEEFTTDNNYYLEISVRDTSGDTTLTPRQRLVSVPMAITAKNVKYSDAVGVLASGTSAGGSFETVSGSAVYARTTGVRGLHRGVYGISNSENGRGVQGSCDDGIGVYGSGEVGVYGLGTTVGGSFEATATSGDRVAVYGITGRNTGVLGYHVGTTQAGIFGKSDSATGVRGESSSNVSSGVYGKNTAGGYGVQGLSTVASGVGVLADNTADGGTALEVGRGKIKVARTAGMSHQSSGVVTMAAEEFSKTVYNGLVDNNSIIILTKQQNNPRTTAGEIFYVGERKPGVGFSISRYVIVRGVSDVENIGYLIIN
jgi:hypothetical protein